MDNYMQNKNNKDILRMTLSSIVRPFSFSDPIPSLIKMLVMTCTLVSGNGGIEMHLETKLHIFGAVLHSNWVVRVSW
ncbi:hypothetical protein GQ457_15G017240 [Hibiscus cannabinus]